MTVYLSSIVGSASIGVYSLATENMVMIPRMVPHEKAQEFADWLKVKLVYTSISGSVLIGSLVCANSNGMIVSHGDSRRRISCNKSWFSKAI